LSAARGSTAFVSLPAARCGSNLLKQVLEFGAVAALSEDKDLLPPVLVRQIKTDDVITNDNDELDAIEVVP
jgi:hypothetical protein